MYFPSFQPEDILNIGLTFNESQPAYAYKRYAHSHKSTVYDDKTLVAIHPLDNPLTVFEKVIDFDELLQHLNIESKRYASCFKRASNSNWYYFSNGLQLYLETGNLFTSISYLANETTEKRIKEILSNLHFSNPSLR